MKITDIKSYPVWVGSRNQFIVKVETDEGIYGLGEAGVSGRELAVQGAVQHYREFLIGRDPMRIGGLWQEMYRSAYFEGGRVLTGAIAAIDIALYDIAGKALGVPFTAVHGSVRFSLSRYNTDQDIDRILDVFPQVIANLRRLSPYWDVQSNAPRPEAMGMLETG